MGTALETLLPTGASLTVAADTFVEAFKLLGGNMVMEAVRFYLENNPANLPQRTVAEVAAEFIANREARAKISPR